MNAIVFPTILSDKSVAYGVRFDVDNGTVINMDCVTQKGAEKLVALLNEEVCDVNIDL